MGCVANIFLGVAGSEGSVPYDIVKWLPVAKLARVFWRFYPDTD